MSDALEGWVGLQRIQLRGTPTGTKDAKHFTIRLVEAVGAVNEALYLIRVDGEEFARLVPIDRLRRYAWFEDRTAAEAQVSSVDKMAADET